MLSTLYAYFFFIRIQTIGYGYLAREALSDYLENKLPLIFEESMAGISDVISQTWEIINNPNISHHYRLHALSFVADCNERRLDMASNGSIVEDGIRFVQKLSDT